MPPSPSRRRFLRAGAALASLALAGCVPSAEPYTETDERSFDPGDATELAVETESGDVSVAPGDGDAVEATVEKESRSGEGALDDVSVERSVDDGTLTIATEYPDRNVNVTVSLDLSVPEDLAVVDVATSNGDVTADAVSGDGTYRSRNGEVSVSDVDGYVTVESTNGDVTAENPAGVDGARTTNGNVTVDLPDLRADVTCQSTNGDVTAAIPDDLSATVSLRTSNGDAETSDVSLAVDESTDRRVEGRLGDDAEHTLELRSTNGDVRLEGL